MNIFLTTDDVDLKNYEMLCEECNQVSIFDVKAKPTFKYKIDRGLLLRAFDFIDIIDEAKVCPCLFNKYGKKTWLFHKPSQEKVSLQDICDFQREFDLEDKPNLELLPSYK